MLYLVFGLLVPKMFDSPSTSTEVGLTAIRTVTVMLEAITPFLAGFILVLAVIAFFRESN